MRRIILYVFISVLLAVVGCEEYTKNDFIWSGTIDGKEGNWSIRCNNECTECEYQGDDNKWRSINQNSYKDVYKACEGYDDADEVVAPVETDIIPSVNKGGLKISSAGGNFKGYGFDDWRSYMSETKKISYMSIKTSSSANFMVNVGSEYFDAYEKVIAYIPDAALKGLSFSEGEVVDVIDFDKTLMYHLVEVFASSNAPTGIPLDVFIKGYDDPKDKACLAGDCGELVEDALKVVVYDEKVYENYPLYVLGKNAVNPSEAEFVSEHNKIIKQVVIKIENVIKQKKEDISDWDKNGNNCLDVYYKYGGVPPAALENDEFLLMVDIIGESDGCLASNNGSSVIVQNRINSHYYITNNATVGSKVLDLNTVADLSIGQEIKIGPWLGGTGTYESVKIDYINSTINVIGICQINDTAKGLLQNHPEGHTFYTNNEIGFNVGSCACMQTEEITFALMTHEFLHEEIVGGLLDLAEVDNVMNGVASATTGTQLRERPVKLMYGGEEQQWAKIKR